MPAAGLAFGSYQLDPKGKRLLRDGTVVPIPVRQFDILLVLASRAGETVTKDELMSLVWPRQFISDGSVMQAISSLRMTLDAADMDRYIVTDRGRGYRFVAIVTRLEPPVPLVDIDALLSPYRALIDGRTALESFDRQRIAEARVTFASLIAQHADDARFHIGLANACALEFESTRTDLEPAVAALRSAVEHAQRACHLTPEDGEASATLGFVLMCTGARLDAQAALSRALTFEPNNGLHWLRFASANWGEAAHRAVRRTLTLMPDAPLAHVLAARVFVARGRLAEAEREIDAAIRATEDAAPGAPSFSAVAVYWLKGLLCLARGADDEAMAALEREIALESRGHLYAKECCANAWYAIGAIHLRRGDTDAARAAFGQAIARVPRHVMAHAGLAILNGETRLALPFEAPATFEIALARAAVLIAAGDARGAAMCVEEALSAALPGNAGWLVPIEPLLGVEQAKDTWRNVLVRLRARAG